VFDESPSTIRVRRFNCCLSPYVLGKNEDTGSVIFTEQCTCGLSEDAFGEIVAVVDEAEAEDGSDIPCAFLVQWGERGIEYQRIGRIH
jgi:hypothetical protein